MSINKRIPSPARPHRINQEIRASQVRVLNPEGEQMGLLPLQKALDEARALKMDLVEINPHAQPPVCRIMDYGKFLYERNKNLRQQKKRQKNVQIKELKFRPTTDIGDYNLKLKQICLFLTAGDKVKVTVSFRGREIMHPEFGHQLLERIKTDIGATGQVESYPSQTEGKQLIMLLAPKKKSG